MNMNKSNIFGKEENEIENFNGPCYEVRYNICMYMCV